MNANSLQNQFLIAMPSMSDPNFAGGVTLVCEHGDDGALGIVVNRPADAVTTADVFDQLDLNNDITRAFESPAYWGGPVAKERGFVLHDGDGSWESTMQVIPGLYVTSSRDILEAIAEGFGPQNWLFALGYAGWEKGQLETEMAENAWLTAPSNADIIFKLPPEKRLSAAAQQIGIDLTRLTSTAGHA